MAFLKFLSKKPKKLDIPPPPPALDIPPPPEELKLPELPPLPEEEIKKPVETLKKIPELRPIREEKITAIKPIPKIPELKKIEEETKKQIEKVEEVGKKEIFLKVDHYKNVLESFNLMKQKINESEKIVERLNEIKNTKDKEFERWRSLLEDIERKFMYIDKTFFEG